MKVALTYYNDIPLSKEEYALKIGATIIGAFNDKNTESVTLVPFNKLNYQKWLKGMTDTQNARAEWATEQIATYRKLPTYKELADYLEVSESAIKQYNPKKRELMLIGLANKKHVID